MARNKNNGIGGIAVVIGLFVAAVTAIPKEFWVGLGVVAVAAVAIYFFAKNRGTADAAPDQDSTRSATQASNRQSQAPAARTSFQPAQRTSRHPRSDDSTVSVSASQSASASYRLPSAPSGYGQATWLKNGQSITVGGVTLSGGMLYIGTALKTPLGENDPCLIDPAKNVAANGDFTERQTNYWPSYSEVSASARRAYLNWLSDGRKHPEADIGYVFLYFYGLERRAILDAATDEEAQADWPVIATELRRLLGIYGDKSRSFQRYAGELLNWVELASHPARLYEKSVPSLPRTFELPIYLRLALGQAAVDGAPVPANLAMAWALSDPNTYLKTPAKRCPDEFTKLFTQKYAATYGPGIILPKNKTKLKFVYRPASSGFRGYDDIKLGFGDTPDVTVLTAPISNLRLLVEAATQELGAYSRYVGRNPGTTPSLEALLQLPATLWPGSAQDALQGLKARMGQGMISITFQELLSTLEAKTAPTKDKVLGLARALESLNIAMEPDVLGGAKTPKADDKVVLFAVPPGEPITRNSPAYQAALLTLQLASAVASADGEFSVQELSLLRKQVQSWTHLTPSHLHRLMAHLRLLMAAPVTLTSLKKKLEPLPMTAKETIAAFMATVAQVDGTVTPVEVKMLEKVYKALGVESKKVFSDVHAAASGSAAGSSVETAAQTGFKLDPARIAALQQDTDKVSALLAGIFSEDDASGSATSEPPALDAEDEAPQEGLLGLDEAHSALARMLLSRPQWSRQELLDVASDLELMLDGALERINEASFDAHGAPFTEGEDPVDVNAELLEKIEA